MLLYRDPWTKRGCDMRTGLVGEAVLRVNDIDMIRDGQEHLHSDSLTHAGHTIDAR